MSGPPLWFDDYHTRASAQVLLLTTDRRLVLQLRDDKPDIHFPGRIAAFGGGAERHETPAACALRELEEETGIKAREQDLLPLDAVSQVDFRGDPTATVFFLLRGIDPDTLVISEGTAVVLSFTEAAADPRLTDNCRRLCAEIAAQEAE